MEQIVLDRHGRRDFHSSTPVEVSIIVLYFKFVLSKTKHKQKKDFRGLILDSKFVLYKNFCLNKLLRVIIGRVSKILPYIP